MKKNSCCLLLIFLLISTIPHANSVSLQTKLTDTKNSLDQLKTQLGTLKDSLETLQEKLKKPHEVSDQEINKRILQMLSLPGAFNKNKLDNYAKVQGFGYKTANLRELKKLANLLNLMKSKTLGFTPYFIFVPEFIGIPAQHIKTFLNTKGLDIQARWKTITSTYIKGIAQTYIDTKKLPAGFLQALKNLENDITNTFEQAAKVMTPTSSLDTPFKTKGVDSLIKKMKSLKNQLMVRSTGKEDTDELANAGGNASVVNVAPETVDIVRAMGTVVASYCSEKSFTQRLGAGDPTLFDEPFTPVLIQRMIGEGADDPKFIYQVPSCGVMFTEDVDGGISQIEVKQSGYKPGDPLKTSGITKIDASYGHNEGVVNSIVSVDTFYMASFSDIHQIIRPKEFRLAPGTSKKLVEKKNDFRRINKPSLSQAGLATLKLIANTLEAYYKKPMDVEFVVDNQRQIIYLVQARPIVHNPKQATPSYLHDPKAIANKIDCKSIVAAGGGLRLITDKKQVIAKDGIKDALDTYLKSDQKNIVEYAIVGERAPGTSHEATQFRTEAKPVAYTDNLNAVTDLMDANTKFIIDGQQGCIGIWSGPETTVKDLISSKAAQDGWVTYPGLEFLSLVQDESMLTGLSKKFESVRNMLVQESSQEAFNKFAQTVKRVKKGKQFAEIEPLLTIVQAGGNNAKMALAVLLATLQRSILVATKNADDDQKQRIKFLQYYFLQTVQEVAQTLEGADPNAELKRRYALGFLKALIYQQPPANTIVFGDSFQSLIFGEIIPEAKARKKLEAEPKIQETKTLIEKIDAGRALIYSTYIPKIALTKDIEDKWNYFINRWEKVLQDATTEVKKKEIQEARDNFASMMIDLARLKILPIWLQTSFREAAKLQGLASSTLAIIKALEKEYNDIKTFVSELTRQQDTINSININAFSDPKTFSEQWGKLNDIATYFSGTTFINGFKATTSLGKIIALGAMNSLVGTFDLAMKSLKSWDIKTGENIDTTKLGTLLATWKEMLQSYMTLLESSINLDSSINTEFKVKKLDISASAEPTPLEKIKEVKEILKKIHLNDEKQLNSSMAFDVSGAAIGSLAAFHPPVTLEDIFTFIHQSLLNVTSFLFSKTDAKKISPPTLCKTIKEQIESINTLVKKIEYTEDNKWNLIHIPDLGHAMTPVSMDLSANRLTYSYNYPLRSHSATFEVSYTKKQSGEECAITCNLFGHNEYARWEKIADLGSILCEHVGFTYNAKVRTQSIEFTFVVDATMDQKKLETVQYIAFALVAMSFAISDAARGIRVENAIYEKTILPRASDSKIPAALYMSKEEFINLVCNFSLTKQRVHSAIMLAVEKMNPVSVDNSNTVISILSKLCKQNSAYALNSNLLWFKKHFTPSAGKQGEELKDYFHPDSIDYYLVGPELFSTEIDTPLFKDQKLKAINSDEDPFKVQEKINAYKGKLARQLYQTFIIRTREYLEPKALQQLIQIVPKMSESLAKSLETISLKKDSDMLTALQNPQTIKTLEQLKDAFIIDEPMITNLKDMLKNIVLSKPACNWLIPDVPRSGLNLLQDRLLLAATLAILTQKLIHPEQLFNETITTSLIKPQKLLLSDLLFSADLNNSEFVRWSLPEIISPISGNDDLYSQKGVISVRKLGKQIDNKRYNKDDLSIIQLVCTIIINQKDTIKKMDDYIKYYAVYIMLGNTAKPAHDILQAIAKDRKAKGLKADDGGYINVIEALRDDAKKSLQT